MGRRDPATHGRVTGDPRSTEASSPIVAKSSGSTSVALERSLYGLILALETLILNRAIGPDVARADYGGLRSDSGLSYPRVGETPGG